MQLAFAFLLALFNRRTENVRIHPVVVPELELVHVEGEIFLADLVERADDATLHDRPKTIDGVGKDVALSPA